jgi:signal transduction histidine kinase
MHAESTMNHPLEIADSNDPEPDAAFALTLINLSIDRWVNTVTEGNTITEGTTVTEGNTVHQVNGQPGAIAEQLRAYVQRTHRPNNLFVGLRCDDDLGHLQRLLQEWDSPSVRTGVSSEVSSPRSAMVLDAIQRAIRMLSSCVSFSNAVEASARRQMYNLAYGLTHEINNPLGNIAARAQRLMATSDTETDRKSLATIVDQAMRAHEMLAEVMRAVQPSSFLLVVGDVNALVQGVFESLRESAIKAPVEWTCARGQEPLFAEIDAHSLAEVLRLIGRNALDVCRPNDSVFWSCEVIPTPGRADGIAVGNGRIRIQVRDTGPGLSPLAQRSAMDLFFSGREHGRGLGISLAVVRRVIEGHYGTVSIRSESGAGCVVEIELPQVAAPAPQRERVKV